MDDASQSQSGVVAGTPQYMSPEQARGESSDHRSDLFSLGSVLYAMCAGHSPFRAKTTMGVLRRVCDESPRPLVEINPDVPEALEAVIERLHAKGPALRYQSAAEVADVLGRQLVQLQRPGARLTRRRTTVAGPPPLPAIKKAEPADDWEPVKPRRWIGKFGSAALLFLLGLAAIGPVAWLVFWEPEALSHFRPFQPVDPPPTVGAARSAKLPGATRQTVHYHWGATVINATQAGRDRPTIIGSGKPATKAWDLADFTAVEIREPFRASLTRADRFEVSVVADDNVLEHVRVTKEGTRLRVRLEDGLTYRLGPDSLILTIALPILEEIDLGGPAHTTIAGFDSDRPLHVRANGPSSLDGSIRAGNVRFDVDGVAIVTLSGSAHSVRLRAHGASKLELEDWQIRGGNLVIGVDGSSSVRLGGSARAATLKAEGASQLDLSDLALDAADVVLAGTSCATIRVNRLLNYELNSTSRLEYLGEPTIGKAKKTGASSVSHR
jgi:eukaryotic-like serine/threonine-protein kinase